MQQSIRATEVNVTPFNTAIDVTINADKREFIDLVETIMDDLSEREREEIINKYS